MSATPQESAESQDAPSPRNDSGGGGRKILLYGLLGLMVAALAYDYLVARPAVNAAYDQITDASMTANRKGAGFLSNEQVRELIGKQPVHTFKDGRYTVEVFHWPGGLIVKPHKLYAVYMKNGDSLMFNRHAKFVYEAADIVTPDRPIAPAPDDEPPASYDEEEMSGGGGGRPEAEGDAENGSGGEESENAEAESAEAEPPARLEAEDESEQ
ncbi:hypothetical protein Mal15_57660 [Stieleria maiorica]|uniref:Uncharacterized protein n=1 Tax=Stieleria maiorica TaxID=2795974 RepID=A0A5B9MRM9_9BACT|nr:hypothetical protein [Stieleria maiorica]QEG01688.1 hypothetical protein Mal15_57660 [Stieleria maiorica]